MARFKWLIACVLLVTSLIGVWVLQSLEIQLGRHQTAGAALAIVGFLGFALCETEVLPEELRKGLLLGRYADSDLPKDVMSFAGIALEVVGVMLLFLFV